MPRPLEKRLGQVEGRRGATADAQSAAAARQRRLLRAEAALGEIIRKAMARAGVDAADAARLALADDAATALAAIPDTQQLWNADAAVQASPTDRTRAAAFAPKINAMTRRFADGARLDFAGASFAELLAWSLAQNPERSPSAPPDSTGATAGEGVGET